MSSKNKLTAKATTLAAMLLCSAHAHAGLFSVFTNPQATLGNLLGTSASPAEPATVHQFANGCYAAKVGGGFLRPGPLGQAYLANGGSANDGTPFFMKPTGLGSYMLYDSSAQYLHAGLLMTRTKDLSDNVEWRLDPVSGQAGTFQLYSPATKMWLNRSPLGTISQTPLQSLAASVQFVPRQGCLPYPELSTNSTGVVKPKQWEDGSVYGIADSHNHMFSSDLFGGSIMHGEVYHKLGVTKALDDCNKTHGDNGWHDVMASSTGAGAEDILGIFYRKPRHKTDGYPTFTDWPKRDTITHNVSYYKWVERAYQGGLRFMNVSLTTNNVICDIYKGLIGTLDPTYRSGSCNDMDNLDIGIARVKGLQDYIDAQSGGPGKGWFRIVYSPQEARDVINQGKMAAIIGLENSNLFNCLDTNPLCTKEYIARKVDEYYKKGVRTMFTIHKFDNAFGSPNVDGGTLINVGNFIENGRFFNMETCESPLVNGGTYHEANITDLLGGVPAGVKVAVSSSVKAALGPNNIISKAIDGAIIYQDPPKGYSHCNAGTLTSKGAFLQVEMMKRGMILEADHLSPKAYDVFLGIARAYDYPFVFSHALTHQQARGFDTWKEPLALGGAAYPMLTENSVGRIDTIRQHAAQRRAMGAFEAVGWGSDNNGMVGLPNACGQDAGGKCTPVTYPFKSLDGQITFDKMVMGKRTVDYNKEGMSTIGQLPEYIEEMRLNGATDADMAALFRSAEGYIRTWERSLQRAATIR
ncbi:MAG: membrane dipeptidase [Aquabacterium sp.]|nr:membrane dipeptidase [Aquabacterium sp.]